MRLYFSAAFWTAIIGDGHVRPVANQLSVSVTQKSESACVIIACVSVMTISSSVENSLLFCVRCCISSVLSFGVVGVSIISSSKFISVNVGMVGSTSGAGMSISKSVGSGRLSAIVSGVSGWVFDNWGCGALNADVWIRPMLFRARINAKRNSAGMSSGNSTGVSTSSGPSVGVSDSGTVSGVGAGDDFRNSGILIFGNGIVISGCLVRTINVVVAMYSGKAANNNMPKTKPGNPRNCACAKCRHWARLNMEKSNMKYKIAHVMAK